MTRTFLGTFSVLLAVVAVAGCSIETPVAPIETVSPSASLSLSVSSAGSGAKTYVIDLQGSVPTAFAASVASAGGVLTSTLDGAGLAVAESEDPAFAGRAARIAGVRTVTEDRLVEWVSPSERVASIMEEESATADVGAQSAAVGSGETFRRIQWNVDAVSAPAAWATGQQGAGARVAIIDGGIHSAHIDIRPNLDVARSRSFVPGTSFNSDVGTFWHGTHVAGIVAAAANNIGTVGIAPRATIIGVKALHNGSGSFSWIINAIYYASTPIAEGGAGANVINMSLGASFRSNDDGAVQLKNALSKATTYAYQRGVTVIAAAGNAATDFDHTSNLLFVPAQSAHVIAVSATGPLNFGGGATNYDRPASYTNFGQSAIAFAGPGGDFQLPGNALCAYPRNPSGSGLQYCWALDMVIAPCRGNPASIGSYCWAAGTSMASPAVAGVAALVIGKNPGASPSQVEAILRNSADDLGKPGNDDYYGRGRVNALRAVQ